MMNELPKSALANKNFDRDFWKIDIMAKTVFGDFTA